MKQLKPALLNIDKRSKN